MKKTFATVIIASILVLLLVQCNDTKSEATVTTQENFNGFESKAKWGEHLVTVSACHDCHTPKKMTAIGLIIDSSLLLAGHIKGSPEPVINKKQIQGKGLVVTNDLTTWVGPWGTSYTANLTSDDTGIGSWTEEQFILALRKGKYKGMEESRNLLPPMPWEMYRNFTDDEINAIFHYLKTTTPVHNVVPGPLPPEDK